MKRKRIEEATRTKNRKIRILCNTSDAPLFAKNEIVLQKQLKICQHIITVQCDSSTIQSMAMATENTVLFKYLSINKEIM